MTWPFSPIVGHMGGHFDGIKPNTMAAFRKAHSLGVRCVEFDVHLCADKPVIRHDESVGSRKVWEVSEAELLASNEAELLPMSIAELSRLGMGMLIDLKIPPDRRELVIPELTGEVLKLIWTHKAQAVITSFDPGVAEFLGASVMGSERGLKGTAVNYRNGDEVPQNVNGYIFHQASPNLCAQLMNSMHRFQRFVGCYDVHGKGRARALLDMGADFVVMDRPDVMIE